MPLPPPFTLTAPEYVSPPIAPAQAATPRNSPPYAIFASLVLGLGLCLSVVAFNAAGNVAHNFWRVSPFSLIASGVAIVLMALMPKTWRKIEATPDELSHGKMVIRVSAVFVLLFVATALIVGTAIGKSGREIAQLLDDFREMSRVGDRISKARSGLEPSVPAHIVMYKQIEPDVQLFAAVLLRLQEELTVYDGKFPEQHEYTAKSTASVEIGLKRASLLQQQIVVAKEIETLDPEPRYQAWKERMQPLLDAEADLDSN